ncbi:MAG: DUF2178 domain-containing protein [Parcubacteria group bacterium]
MTKKTFTICKVVAVIIVGFVTGVSVNNGNWYLPIAFLVTAWVSLFALKNRVKGVIADERDYRLAGKASMRAMTTYNALAVIAGLILYISEKDNAVLFSVGSTLLYSACLLMIIYSILFKIYERKDERN